jgi:tetratricopeptide (TPR) repeat protein
MMIVALLWRLRRRMAGPTLFFLSWFCIELFPVSQIVTTIGVSPGYISAAEHFLYMPSVGIFALIAVGGQRLYHLAIEKNIGSPLFLRLTITGIFVALMLMTARQGYYAQSATVMFLRTLKYNPNNTRILYSMGLEMVNRKRYGEAEQYFRKTLDREPFHAFAHHALGRALHDQGKYAQGLAVYQSIKDAGRSDALLEKNLQMIYPLAIAQYKERLAKDQGNARLHYSLGTVYSRAGQMEKGVEEYLQAVALQPDFKEALFNLASSYEALGQTELAAAFYERLLAIDGKEDDFDAYAHGRLEEIDRMRVEAEEVRSKT